MRLVQFVATALLLSIPAEGLAAEKTCEERVSELEARIKELEAQLVPKAGAKIEKSDEGYQNTKWGMSKAEVRKLFPKLTEKDGMLFLESKVTGKDALVGFMFSEGKLTIAVVVFTLRFTNKNQWLVEYAELQELLTKKYGPPSSNESFWSQDLYRDDPSDYGMAVSVGHLKKWSTWETPKTKVELSLTGDNFDVTLRIRYASKELEELQKLSLEKEKTSDL